MPFALACASHSPVMLNPELADDATCMAVKASFDRMANFVEDFAPDHIIQFAPDHFHGFNYGLMPSFCVGTAARSYGDWATSDEPLKVDEVFALQVLDAARAGDVDAALSYAMVVDHGFVQMWELMFGRADRYPVVPIFVNCAAPPLPTYRRARLLGEAVGRFARRCSLRILFAASGGLSHDPLVPQIAGASPEVRARLTGAAALTRDEQRARETKVLAVAADAARGEGPVRPLNPAWDACVLEMIAAQDWEALDALDTAAVDAVAGSGANELLAWVAASAAMGATGQYRVAQKEYRPAPGWISGVAHLTATGEQT